MSELIIKKLIWEQCGFTEVNGIFKFKDCKNDQINPKNEVATSARTNKSALIILYQGCASE